MKPGSDPETNRLKTMTTAGSKASPTHTPRRVILTGTCIPDLEVTSLLPTHWPAMAKADSRGQGVQSHRHPKRQ